MPSKYASAGRPESVHVTSAIDDICEYLENNSEECQFYLSKLMNVITECVNSNWIIAHIFN